MDRADPNSFRKVELRKTPVEAGLPQFVDDQRLLAPKKPRPKVQFRRGFGGGLQSLGQKLDRHTAYVSIADLIYKPV